MATAKKVKWSLGSDEPADLSEFLSNDEIIQKFGLPTKGVYKFAVRRLSVKPNKNGDDRISVMLVIDEDKKSKAAKWNGFLVWDGLNVTEQSAPFIKRWLKAMGLTWDDFISKTKQDDQDPPHIIQIGKVKFESGKDPHVDALVKVKPADDWNDDEHLEIARYIPLDVDGEGDEDEAEDEADEDEVIAVLDDEEEEEAEDEDAVDLDDLDIKELKALAKARGFKVAELKGLDEDELRDILTPDDEGEAEEEEEDEAEDDDAEAAEEELREELEALKIGALRKRVLTNDEDAETDGLKKADLIDLIVAQELAPF